MKYLNKLFAFEDRNSHQKSSATLTSSLYSVTFVVNPSQSEAKKGRTDQADSSSVVEEDTFSQNRVTIISHAEQLNSFRTHSQSQTRSRLLNQTVEGEQETSKRETEQSSLGGYLLTATIGKTIASTSTITPIPEQPNEFEEDNEWILVDNLSIEGTTIESAAPTEQPLSTTSIAAPSHNRKRHGNIRISKLKQMAMDKTDVELIRASWLPVRKDPVALGVLLFKGLFTKFPQYLKFFPQFNDLDIERMQEHKRLLRHAVKVIETVTFVVDSIGDETKSDLLNEALVNLVRGHLNRRIGLAEFRNLGIVLIDFICDVNNRRGTFGSANKQANQLNKSSTSDSSNQSSNDSETMTSALDKIRTSSPSSSSEEESYLAGKSTENNNLNIQNNYNTFVQEGDANVNAKVNLNEAKKGQNEDVSSGEPDCPKGVKLDTNLLVAAWTKLYSSILDLVKREEDQATK